MKRFVVRLTAGLLAAGLLTACGSSNPGPETSGGDAGYPLTVENCGADVTLDAEPERVMIVNSAPLQYLASLEALDRLTSRAGRFPPEYYDDEVVAAIEKVPSLTERLAANGHLKISLEQIIAQEPDLLLGLPEGIDRESLEAAGIPVLLEPSFCPEGIQDPGYQTVYEQMRLYGKVFDRSREAEQAVADLEKRVADIEALQGEEKLTAAVLWPYRGEGTIGAYGGQSMATPQLDSLGVENVFGDVDKRVFEVSMEQLLGRDPDLIILLHTDGTDADIRTGLIEIPGAEDLRAVREDKVMVSLFNFTEPPTPLVLDGLERIAAYLEGN